MIKVRIWDLPTRVFHWMLALTMVASVVSAKIGGNAMVWHFRFGYLMAALLIFRLVWGLIGGRWSRFSSFLYTPRAVLAYLRGQRDPQDLWEVGHSPAGALSVFALLAVLLLQVATGLVADDDISNIGPLNRYVSSAVAGKATGWHGHWGQWIIIALVVLHIAAIVYYTRVKRKQLVGPMLHGDKHLAVAVDPSRDTWGTRITAALVWLLGLGVMWWVSLQSL